MHPPESQRLSVLSQEIERIKLLDLGELGLEWRNSVRKRAPKGLSKSLLAKILLYQLQAAAFGDLDPQIARLLEGYAARGATDKRNNVADSSRRAVSETLTIKPGSVLNRDWGGRTHRVMALELGFAWEGKNYRCLSEVARMITGTRWNGRRFFGVDRKGEGGRLASDARGAPRPGPRGDATRRDGL